GPGPGRGAGAGDDGVPAAAARPGHRRPLLPRPAGRRAGERTRLRSAAGPSGDRATHRPPGTGSRARCARRRLRLATDHGAAAPCLAGARDSVMLERNMDEALKAFMADPLGTAGLLVEYGLNGAAPLAAALAVSVAGLCV